MACRGHSLNLHIPAVREHGALISTAASIPHQWTSGCSNWAPAKTTQPLPIRFCLLCVIWSKKNKNNNKWIIKLGSASNPCSAQNDLGCPTTLSSGQLTSQGCWDETAEQVDPGVESDKYANYTQKLMAVFRMADLFAKVNFSYTEKVHN